MLLCIHMTYTDGLVQEKRNSGALAMELRLSCTNPSICIMCIHNITFHDHLYPDCVEYRHFNSWNFWIYVNISKQFLYPHSD